jgi:predicted metal-dependent hydrolase
MSYTVVDVPGVPPDVEVRRSTRRRRSVTAYREGGLTVVVVPARMSRADIVSYVDELVGRLDARDRRARRTDAELQARALERAARYLDERGTPSTVRWVSNQRRRWGSCTPADRAIRLSDRLQTMPTFVSDYVLLHELVHLLVPGHGPDFEAWMTRYPRLLEARAFLAGVDHVLGAGVDTFGEPDDVEPTPQGTVPADTTDSSPDDGATATASLADASPLGAVAASSAADDDMVDLRDPTAPVGVAALRRTARSSRHDPGPGAEPLF